MILLTPRFGSVSFEPEEVIVFEQGLQGWQELRQWLLLADAAHPRLFWLQSIRRPLVALPVIAVSPDQPDRRLPLSCPSPVADDSSPLKWNVLLLYLQSEGNDIRADLQHPILIDTDRGRGVQFGDEGEQSLQWVRSEQVMRLRKSA